MPEINRLRECSERAKVAAAFASGLALGRLHPLPLTSEREAFAWALEHTQQMRQGLEEAELRIVHDAIAASIAGADEIAADA